MRHDKKWTIIKAPAKKMPEVKYHNCKIHRVRMEDVEGTLRCPLCGSPYIAEETEDSFRISGTI